MLELSTTIRLIGMPEKADHASLAESVLRYDCFLGDVTRRSEKADLSAYWGWIPILDFELSLVRLLKALHENEEEVLEFTESEAGIRFSRHDNVTAVTASYANGVVSANHFELTLHAEMQLTKTLQHLFVKYPGLRNNVGLGRMVHTACEEHESGTVHGRRSVLEGSSMVDWAREEALRGARYYE